MSKIVFGGPGEIPPVPVSVPGDAMENDIRRWGVISMCEWFGHHADSEFTAWTIATLRERSEAAIARATGEGHE